MLGRIELEQFKGLLNPTQDAASAMCVFEGEEKVGGKYKPILYLGKQVAKGTDYFFIAEQTFSDKFATRHIVAVTVNGINGEYEIVGVEEVL